jgi:hypothetical protein
MAIREALRSSSIYLTSIKDMGGHWGCPGRAVNPKAWESIYGKVNEMAKRKVSMPRRLSFLLVLLIFSVASINRSASAQEKDYYADHYNVDVAIQPGGDLLVTETVEFHFTGGPFTYAYRNIPIEYMDGIRDIAAWMDGQPMPEGTGPGEVEIENGDPLKITWHFPETVDSAHTFVLSYRVLAGIGQANGLDFLDWDALPNEHEYPINSSLVHVTYPDLAELAREPEVLRGQAEIRVTDQEVFFQSLDLGADDPLEIRLIFPAGSLVSAPPAWQVELQTDKKVTAQSLWAGLLALLLAVPAGAIFLGVFVRRSQSLDRSEFTTTIPMSRPCSPPEDLPPALAGALTASNLQVTWPHALGSLIDLARRGALSFEEQKKWGRFKREFMIHLGTRPGNLLPHESLLLDYIFQNPLNPSTSLSELSSRVPGMWQEFQVAVGQEIEAKGFISSQRQAQKNRLNNLGFTGLLLGIGVVVAIMLFIPNLPASPVKIALGLLAGLAGALAITGLMAVISASRYSPLTSQGDAQAELWKGFSGYLKDVTKGKEPPMRSDFFEAYLPFATSFGLGKTWTRLYQEQGGVPLPSWFISLTPDSFNDSMSALVVFMDTSASSGDSSSGGGGGDGGGGGGGSSGAG